MKLIGVDVGGTKITAVRIENEKIVCQFTCDTPFDQEMMVVVDAISSAIYEVYDPEVLGIGIGVPGLVDLQNNTVIDVLNIPSWVVVPLKKLIEGHFQKPVFVNNDANCFALGEKYFGVGKAYQNFIGLTIGTGLGAGIIINNHLYSGRYCGAGEFGSIYYMDKTIEAYASGQYFKDKGLSGVNVSKKAINGDPEAIRLFNEFGGHIGRVIGNVLFALAPEAIILGGSVCKSYDLFEPGMRFVLENEFPYQRLYHSVKIEISELQNIAGLGASSLVLDTL